MNNIITLFLLLKCLIIFSQDKEAKITYKVYLNEITNEKTDVYKKIADKGLKKIEFELLTEKENSVFILKDNITNSDSDSKMGIAFSKYMNPIFYDKVAEEFKYNNNFSPITPDEEFLITVKDTVQWKITKESKIINDYICYKALKTRSLYGVKNKSTYQVTAWFCPQINLSFGPLYYNGLPGLIIELQDRYVTYVISNIEFVKSNNKIEKLKPTKGKIVSEKEFNDILEFRMNETKTYIEESRK